MSNPQHTRADGAPCRFRLVLYFYQDGQPDHKQVYYAYKMSSEAQEVSYLEKLLQSFSTGQKPYVKAGRPLKFKSGQIYDLRANGAALPAPAAPPAKAIDHDRELRQQQRQLEDDNRQDAESKLAHYRRQGWSMRCDQCRRRFPSDKIEVAASSGWISFGFFCPQCMES